MVKSGGQGHRARLAAVIGDLNASLIQHLDDEEKLILPLVEEHLTVAEWEELGEKGRGSLPPEKLLIFLGAILEDAPPSEQAAFLGKMPLPARIVWRLLGGGR